LMIYLFSFFEEDLLWHNYLSNLLDQVKG